MIIRTTTNIKWKQIKDFPDYYISNNGMVKGPKGLLNQKLPRKGYYYVYLLKYNNGVRINHRYDVHRLVWENFGEGKSNRKLHIHHRDLNPKNNHIENLMLLDSVTHRILHTKYALKNTG